MRLYFSTLLLFGIVAISVAQWEDYDYGDYSDPYATQTTDSTNNGFDEYESTDDGGSFDFNASGGGSDYVRSARPAATSKSYERYNKMPFDSSAGLITYVEIVEIVVPDNYLGDPFDLSDSLYARARNWMNTQFGEKAAKKMIDASGDDEKNREGQTIEAVMFMPLYYQANEHSKQHLGMIEFSMELRFKDGRFRYKFNNFTHITTNPTKPNKDEEVYLEYYVTAKQNVRNNDRILKATDDQITTMIASLKDSCGYVPFVDDDDW